MADPANRAYVEGLKMLGRRELCEAQVRARLARKQFQPDEIDTGIERLKRERALDDQRTALACARSAVRVKRRGRGRVVRQLEAIGIERDVARAAVAQVFGEVDENLLLEEALDRRLARGVTLSDPAGMRRVHRYLLTQGFDAARVSELLRRRRLGTGEP